MLPAMAVSTRPKRVSTPKRDHLLETAFRLFYRDGYHAVGIDTILAEAGLAKMTLYHHFKSKEELIVAALERRGEQIRVARGEYNFRAVAGKSPRNRGADAPACAGDNCDPVFEVDVGTALKQSIHLL